MAALETEGSRPWRRREKGKLRPEPTADETQQAAEGMTEVQAEGKGNGEVSHIPNSGG